MAESINRDIEGARDAYKSADAEKSRMAHLAKAHEARESMHNKKAGEIVSSIVFGGLDGIVTTFAVLVAAAANQLIISLLLILTFANLVGDAVGMAVGDWLSTLAEEGVERRERERERKEYEQFPEEERLEMELIYQEMGMSVQDSRDLVDLLSENTEAFLKIMCIYELGIMEEEDVSSAWKDGLTTFVSFMICGSIPMLAYVFCFTYSSPATLDKLFWISIGLFCVTLLALGAVKGIITNSRWWLSALLTLIQGAITTVAAYFISYGFEQIGGQHANQTIVNSTARMFFPV